jgi:small-conductance mechanosensitive channel
MDVEVAYESDIDLAMKLMAEIIGEHPLYVDVRTEEEKETKEKVEVQVRALGASGIALRAKVWTETVNDNFKACSDIRLQLKKTYDEHGIEIPYTKYTILKQE